MRARQLVPSHSADEDSTEETAKMEIGQLVRQYVNERVRRGDLRPGSIPTVRCTLATLVQVVGWELPPNRLRLAHIEKWMERKYRGRPLSDATKRSQLSVVRTFCSWLVRRGHARTNVALDATVPREPRYMPRGVRNQAVADTHAACPDTRADLIVTLEVQQGLRACEVCGLQLGDIDPELRLMLVRGKGGHERVLPITTDTWTAMSRYLAERPAVAGPLIRSYNHPNRPIGARYVSRLVSLWMRSAGLNATGHALRHTAATDMLRRGAHVRDVQHALGHGSLATTQRYLPWLVDGPEGLRKAMEGRSYRRPVQPTLFEVIPGGMQETRDRRRRSPSPSGDSAGITPDRRTRKEPPTTRDGGNPLGGGCVGKLDGGPPGSLRDR